jgi:hypothetical protein
VTAASPKQELSIIMKSFGVFITLAAALVLSLGACGSSGETQTVTVVERDATPDGSKATTSGSDAADSGASDEAAPDVGSDEGAGSASTGGSVIVPNEVGKNHQAAQDDLQAHGLYNLSEEDATGQDRLLIWDRNWKVVSQHPAPGTKVSEDATITLRSKKYTDG